MIKLTRPPKPQILVDNERIWVQPLLEAIKVHGSYKDIPKLDKEKLISFYRHNEIKQSLFPSSNYKCAFCEGKPSENGNIEVEHFLPKSIYPEQIFSWENLLPACRKCNDAKRAHDSHLEPIINPYNEDPEELFFYTDIRITPIDNAVDAARTVVVCELNSVRLMGPRAEILVSLHSFDQSLSAALSDLDQATGERARNNRIARIAEGIEVMDRLTANDQRYAGFCRHYLKNSLNYQQAKEILKAAREESEANF